MTKFEWENKCSIWSEPPSDTEEQRIANAEKMIKEAIKSSEKLKDKDIMVFIQGSYRNNVNVKQNSDIDIGVLCKDIYYPIYPNDATKNKYGGVSGEYSYSNFKQDLYDTLVVKFGKESIKRGNKAIDVKANTYRVDADVVAVIQHRLYNTDGSYKEGTMLRPDNNYLNPIINWPEQHYSKGVEKNKKTNKRYKALVRVIKKLALEMGEKGYASAINISGFFIECLVYNVPDKCFDIDKSYYQNMRDCLQFLYTNTSNSILCDNWREVSELKDLFRNGKNNKDANKFLIDALDYTRV